MRKFKHKITGDIVKERYNLDNRFYTNGIHSIPALFVENSNDWIEIKDEFPKVLSVRLLGNGFVGGFAEATLRKNGLFLNSDDPLQEGMYTLEESIKKDFVIYQVAVDKDTIFTVGDKVEFPGYDPGRIITKFWINEENELDSLSADFGEYGYMFVKQLKKVKSPILTTFDNKEVYIGDTVWNLVLPTFQYHLLTVSESYKTCALTTTLFASREAMLKYIEENKPKYSVKDIENALKETSGRVKVGQILVDAWGFKQKLGL